MLKLIFNMIAHLSGQASTEGHAVSKMSPTSLLKYQFGVMLNIFIFLFIGLFGTVYILWRDAGADRVEYIKSVNGFHLVLSELTVSLKQRDLLLEKIVEKVDRINTNIIILGSKISQIDRATSGVKADGEFPDLIVSPDDLPTGTDYRLEQ